MARVNPSPEDVSFLNPAHARWAMGVLSMVIAVVGRDSMLGLILRQTCSDIRRLVRDEKPKPAARPTCYENN